MCERWRASFTAFLEDMGKAPSEEMELDRINNNGNYEPGNVRWVTPKTNSNNRRNNRYITFNGKTQTLMQWSEEVGIKRSAIQMRLDQYGWTVEQALTLPNRARPPR